VFTRFWNGFSRPIFVFRRIIPSVRAYIEFAWRYKAFLLGGAAFYLYLYPAKLILASSRSVEEAGLYGVATMFGGAYYAVTMAAFNSYYPKLLVAYGHGVEHYKTTVRWVVLIITLTGLLAWAAIIVFRGLLLSIVGAQFDVSLSLAPALLLSKALGGLVLVARGALLVKRKERISFGTFLAIELAVFGLNLFVIPRYGILGASIVEISQEIFHLTLLTLMLYKFDKDRVG
jgi:O-antigen/teichoic acid export membrane protein